MIIDIKMKKTRWLNWKSATTANTVLHIGLADRQLSVRPKVDGAYSLRSISVGEEAYSGSHTCEPKSDDPLASLT